MIEIQLTQGKVAIVDDDDYELVCVYKWHAHYDSKGNTYYARTNTGKKPNRTTLLMHRLIMGADRGDEIDHINHSTLDNRRGNLRLCDRYGNTANTRPRKDSKTGYKGITVNVYGDYVAYVFHKGKMLYLGRYKDINKAIIARDQGARRIQGEFAYLNMLTAAQ